MSPFARKPARVIAVLAGFAVAASTGFVLAHQFNRPSATADAADAGPSAPQTPEPTGPVVDIASGTEAGTPWVLSAYTAKADGGPHGGTTDALCVNWEYPDRPGDNSVCIVDFSQMLDRGTAFGPMSHFNDGDPQDAPRSAFFGLTPANTRSVHLSPQGSPAGEARLYGPFEEFGGARFFVGFAPPMRDVVVAARGEAGEVQWQHRKKVEG